MVSTQKYANLTYISLLDILSSDVPGEAPNQFKDCPLPQSDRTTYRALYTMIQLSCKRAHQCQRQG